MKVLNALLFFFLFFITNASAQNNGLTFTPKVGLSYNSVYNPSLWEYKFSPLLIAFEVSKQHNDKVSWNLELGFARKGTHSKKVDGVREQDYFFDNLILSYQFNYRLFENRNLEIGAGSYLGYSLSAKWKIVPAQEFSKYEGGSHNKTDFGVNLSLRQFVPLGNLQLLLEPRFQLGLIKFSNSKQISYQFLTGLVF